MTDPGPNRAQRRAKKPPPTPATTYSVEWTPEELAFLRILLTNAQVQPAVLKRICGACQEKVEAVIGPLQPPPQ